MRSRRGSGCPGCEEQQRIWEENQRTRQYLWSHLTIFGDDSRRGNVPLPWGLDRNRIELPVAQHTCPLGNNLYWPTTEYTARGRPLRIRDSRTQRVEMRLILHISAPENLEHPWAATIELDGIFPLFGDLRRFWGVAMRFFGRVRVLGEEASRERNPVVDQNDTEIDQEVLPPGPTELRMSPLTIRIDVMPSPRADVMLQGASLQWYGLTSRGRGETPFIGSHDQFTRQLTRYLRANTPNSRRLPWHVTSYPLNRRTQADGRIGSARRHVTLCCEHGDTASGSDPDSPRRSRRRRDV